MDVIAFVRRVYTDRIFRRFAEGGGIYVIDEKWDNLIILDACRYDLFEEMNILEGKLESRISRGSDTTEFLTENFARHPTRHTFDDTVYVAGNPLVSSILRNKFHKIYPVWDYGWDDRLNTVMPSNVKSEALAARRDHPDKRLIVHFMQPHFPALTGRFAGETGIEGTRRLVKIGVDPVRAAEEGPLDVLVSVLLQRGDLDRDDVLSAYKENLKIVLAHAAELVKEFPGRTVITSDHGETFGERPGVLYPFRVYGHPRHRHVKPLVVVPWLISEKRGEIAEPRHEEPSEEAYSEQDDEKIKERLRKLGYM
jgi:hypothetical protein